MCWGERRRKNGDRSVLIERGKIGRCQLDGVMVKWIEMVSEKKI